MGLNAGSSPAYNEFALPISFITIGTNSCLRERSLSGTNSVAVVLLVGGVYGVRLRRYKSCTDIFYLQF